MLFVCRNLAMHQQVTGNCSSVVAPNRTAGLQPLRFTSNPLQAPAGFQSPNTASGITQNTVFGSTPSTFPDMASGIRPGVTPGTTPITIPSISATDINSGSNPSTALGMAPSAASDIAPGSHSTATRDMVAAAPTRNIDPSTVKMPGQVATPRWQTMLRSQNCKALPQPASTGTQHCMTGQNSSRTQCEPLDDCRLHDGNSSDPQQQVIHPRAVAAAEVHQQMPANTTAQSSSKKKRKKLLQQGVLPFLAANGEPIAASEKPPILAKSRAKKPNKQPVSLVHCTA